MTRAIIRAYFGINDNSDRILARKKRVDGNLKVLHNNKYLTDCVWYVWGKDNAYHLREEGFSNIRMVSDFPFTWDIVKYCYRHKLEAIKIACSEFDEIIQCDVDVLPLRPFTDEIWNSLGRKESFQANLYQYRKPKCWWRKTDQRKLCNGGFTYHRGMTDIEAIIKVWEQDDMTDKKSCEPAMSRYVDSLTDGFDSDTYLKYHEPDCCRLYRNSPYGKEHNPKASFVHFAGMGAIRNIYEE